MRVALFATPEARLLRLQLVAKFDPAFKFRDDSRLPVIGFHGRNRRRSTTNLATNVAGMMDSTAGLVPVHIGQLEPGTRAEQRSQNWRRAKPASRIPAGLDWGKHGVEPRWLGMDSSDCPIALEPSTSYGSSTDELSRFLAGAERRKEAALVVSVIGHAEDDSPPNPLAPYDCSVRLSETFSSVHGRRLPAGAKPKIAPGVDAADRDLALRLLARPADAPWWTLKLHGATFERAGGSGTESYDAEGELCPILVDSLGEPVVARWTPPSGAQRWYIVPDGTDWGTLLDWLVQRALPTHVPDALRRARSPHFVDPDLQTLDEFAARQALAALEAQYAGEMQRIKEELHRAEAAANPIRYALLYGTGGELVKAVATVLTRAGLHAIDLDEELGATSSADLLVTDGARQLLIEVKAASGAAGEQLVSHLERHLTTWPQLRPDSPVDGGVLIVNHQHRVHPAERTARVFSRPEFVASLNMPVISSFELFNWWRRSDWASIRDGVVGIERSAIDPTSTLDEPTAQTGRRWRWPGTRSRK